MEYLKDLLDERINYLNKLKNQKERSLKSAPKGTLHIHNRKNKKTQYYHKYTSDKNPVYIKEKDYAFAEALAQKEYDQKVICSAREELDAIEKYRKSFPNIQVEDIFENLSDERKKMVYPVMLPDDQYVEKWMDIRYSGLPFDENLPEHYTSKNERVRSKSEVIIADALARAGVPYKYECPMELYNRKVIYPDFTVLNVRLRKVLYWEHFGLMNQEDYVERTIRKINDYEMSKLFPGEHLIFTYETQENPLNQKIVNLLIQRYLL